MKRINILIIIILGTLGLGAQTVDDSWKQHSRHELTLGFSDPVIQSLFCNADVTFVPLQYLSSEVTPMDWFVTDCYRGKYGMTLPITMTYRYRVAKWLWIGGSVAYFGIYSTCRDRLTDEVVARPNRNVIAIAPTLHFSWLNRKYVSLYSGLSGGYSLIFGKEYYTTKEKCEPVLRDFWNLQVTAIGVKAGKKWFGFAEAGIGTQGFVTAGVGYRFNEND